MDAMLENHSKTNFWLRPSTVYVIFFLSINILNIQSIVADRINVWDIFHQGFAHLVKHKDLYLYYPAEYGDVYLYSPSFAVMFAPFSKLPYYIGYFLWNDLSMMLIPFLIYKLKWISEDKKSLICYIIIIDLLTCLQGTQTNPMIASMMLLSFLSFENKNYWIAAFAIAIGFYIKIFPVVAASLFILYPDKIKFLLRLLVAFIIIGALPLLFIKPSDLLWQYHNWVRELLQDQHDNDGISVIGLVGYNFGISDIGKVIIQLMGLCSFLCMFIRIRLYKSYMYRLFFLSAMLVWVALFNHAAEIYSYAISIIGIGIWYVCQPKNKWLDRYMLFFILVASVLSIDPTPKFISHFMYDHSLKALPFLIMYLVIIYQMFFKKSSFFNRLPVTDAAA